MEPPSASGRKADVVARDDFVLPFATVRSGAKGRLVRMGASVDTILTRHHYPEPVSEALAHALVLTAMLGSMLGPGGRLSLQTKSDGPLGFLFADCESPGLLRTYASFSEARLAALEGRSPRVSEGDLLGNGHLALTLDPGGSADTTQGIVAINGDSISTAARTYFRQSEQLPTLIRLAVARELVPVPGTTERRWAWRAGGILVQHEGGQEEPSPDDESEAADDEIEARSAESHDDDPSEAWTRVRLLAATVEDHELIDPGLAPERLLLRLFHEEGVRTFPLRPLAAHCRCSRERVLSFLAGFGSDQIRDLTLPDGSISVTCEFCRSEYRFALDEIGR